MRWLDGARGVLLVHARCVGVGVVCVGVVGTRWAVGRWLGGRLLNCVDWSSAAHPLAALAPWLQVLVHVGQGHITACQARKEVRASWQHSGHGAVQQSPDITTAQLLTTQQQGAHTR